MTMLQLALLLMLQVPGQDAILKKDGQDKALEYKDAIEVNIRPECRDILAPIVAAIRYAENGGKGKEYGILHPRVKPSQLASDRCAATVQKNYDRWVKAGRKGEFIVFLGNRYCPVGAENDPNGLNKNWTKNVRFYVDKFTK